MPHKINWRFWWQFSSFSQEIDVHALFSCFLCAVAKLQKATINFVMSVYLSIHPHEMIQLTLDGFSWNYIFEFFLNILRKFKFHSDLSRIMGTLDEDQYKFLIISHSVLLRLGNDSDRTCREFKMHIWCSKKKFFFFQKLCFYEIMWENIVKSGRPQMIVWHMHIASWMPTATDTHS